MRRIGALGALIAVALFAVPAASSAGSAAPGDVPLVDQTGAPFHLRDLLGRPAAIAFVATRCQDTCPIVNAVFSRLAQGSPRARLVTISLDPGYDTPFVMSNFARELQARAPAWRFVTGRAADVAGVLAAFGVVVAKGADGIPDAHSDFIYVLDRHGRLSATLPLSTHSVTDLRATLSQPALVR
jgi:cytochrome oxidase Cu insertion factor (SCO1/SenC/PrrC family)